MATAAMTPPPGNAPDSSSDPNQSAPAGGAPAPSGVSSPAQPGTDSGMIQQLIVAVQTLRAVAKSVPKAAPHIAQIMQQVPHVMAAVQAQAQPGEAQAPPG